LTTWYGKNKRGIVRLLPSDWQAKKRSLEEISRRDYLASIYKGTHSFLSITVSWRGLERFSGASGILKGY
jgi:hypothetical protein